MRIAKVFKNGNSQAVRLPKDYQFDASEVEISRRGEEIVLRKKKENLKEAFELLARMPGDFFAEGRTDPLPEEREEWH